MATIPYDLPALRKVLALCECLKPCPSVFNAVGRSENHAGPSCLIIRRAYHVWSNAWNATLAMLDRNSFLYIVYKTVSKSRVLVEKRVSSKENVQKWLSRSMSDPLVKILVKSSNLTKTQLECLLIDFLAQNLAPKSLTNEEKASFRLSKSEISRGAFNHTLKQARRNVIQSMYTMILIGYVGMFDDTRLNPYLEVANKLREYMNAYQDLLSDEAFAKEHLQVINALRNELENSLEKLSNTRSLSKL